MSDELRYLTWVSLLTGVTWVPYILNVIMVRGVKDAVGYPSDPKPMAPWATRMKAAHYNAIENLVVFAALVLVAHVVGAESEATALACAIYFWARLVHLLAFTLAVPLLRTLTFFAGFLCQMTLAWQILT